METKEVKQPKEEIQKELLDINDDRKSTVAIDGRKPVKIGWIKPYSNEKITRAMFLYAEEAKGLEEDVDALRSMSERSSTLHKIAAYALLNNFFKINLFYWIKWRWMYYVQEWTFDQLLPIIQEAKKKVPSGEYVWGITLAATMMETTMMMTSKEAERYRQELLQVEEQLLAKNSPTQ